MKNLLREILKSTLFSPGDERKLVFVPQYLLSDKDNGKSPNLSWRSSISSDSFPSDCQIYRMPDGEDFLPCLIEKVPVDQPVRIFVFPPCLSPTIISDNLCAQYQSRNFGMMVLTSLLEAVADGSLVWASLPESCCGTHNSSARERIAKVAQPRLFLANDEPDFPVTFALKQFYIRTVGFLFEKGHRNEATVRYFKCPRLENEVQCSQAIADFKKLFNQPGGKTSFGFVLREGVPPTESWLYDARHPDLTRRQADLALFGAVRRMGDLVEVVRGFILHYEKKLLTERDSEEGVAVLEDHAIKADGTIDLDETRYRANVPAERQVQAGDICIRSNRGSGEPLVCAIVESGMPAATPGNGVITLRFHEPTLAQHSGFLASYIRSSAFLAFLQAHGVGNHVRASEILELPVPIADEPLLLAVEALGHAATQFREWAEELEIARSSLFETQSARNARINAMSIARLAKQRYEAAALVGDFCQRVRTRFPHPIAFRWRTVESQHANLEGYIQVLECAEVTVTYLAVMALLLAKAVNKPVPWLSQLSKRISTTGHGTNMGDWVSILQDVKGGKFADDLPDTAPFVEVTRFQLDKRVEDSLKKLAECRNDQSHGRGPKGSAAQEAFSEAKKQLEILLQGVEFLSDYPLRFVEETRRDTLRRTTNYSFRELLGDHALVPIAQGETPDAEIEAKSLYLNDRAGKLHLLRPLLIGRECPVCQSWGTFFLDTLARRNHQLPERIVIKSLEHGHTCDDMDLLAAFRHWGMIQ
jgi:hypothetical protein